VPFPPAAHERAALPLVGSVLDVDPAGRVWKLRRYDQPCKPYPAESTTSDGYLAVPLVLPGGRYVTILAHRLVYEVRCGGIPDGKRVRHRNDDRADNRPENLVAGPPWPDGMVLRRKKLPDLA